jgi:hypothetical protein
MTESIRKSEKFKIGRSKTPESLGFSPSEESLLSCTEYQLKQIYIQKIAYFKEAGLYSLTFILSDNIRSPPKKSYKQEPTEAYTLPEGHHMSQLLFGLDANPQLVSVQISADQKMIHEIKGTNGKFEDSQIIKLANNEHIVSANVEVKKKRWEAQTVQFIIFTL